MKFEMNVCDDYLMPGKGGHCLHQTVLALGVLLRGEKVGYESGIRDGDRIK
jgi:hypothetical protein